MNQRLMRNRGFTAAVLVMGLMLSACGGDTQQPDAAGAGQGDGASAAARKAADIQRFKAVTGDDALELYRAGLALMQYGELEAGVEKLEAARELAPENAAVHNALALAYPGMDRWDEALLALETSVELAPEDADAVVALSRRYLDLQRFEDARELLDAALVNQSESATLHVLRAAPTGRASVVV